MTIHDCHVCKYLQSHSTPLDQPLLTSTSVRTSGYRPNLCQAKAMSVCTLLCPEDSPILVKHC